jgi:hypothetical protein
VEAKKIKKIKKGINVAKRQVKTVNRVASNYSSLARAKSLQRISLKKQTKKEQQ